MAEDTPDIKAPEAGPGLVRDIQWVYDNWSRLFVETELGTIVVDEDVMEEAPSAGARAMVTYANRKPDGFFDRFVIKLLPKDAGATKDDEATKKNQLAELDPSFDEMKDFFSMQVEPERPVDLISAPAPEPPDAGGDEW